MPKSLEEVREVGDVGEIREVGDVGEIREVGDVGEIREVGDVGGVGEVGKEKCYFSTFIDEVTITCSSDGIFDFYGFPVNLCDKLPFCDRIKEMNKGLSKENKSGIKK